MVDDEASALGGSTDFWATQISHHRESSRQRLRHASTEVQRAILSFVHSLGTSRTSCSIELGRFAFTLVWFVLLTIHICLGLYYFFVAYLHWYMIAVYCDSMVIGLGNNVREFFSLVIVANATLASLHAIYILVTLFSSAWERRLTFGIPKRLISSFASNDSRKQPFTSHILVRKANSCLNKLFGSAGLFGIEGQHFELVFHITEIVETGAQTYQAWKLSNLVPSVWINRMYAIMIAVNCWATPSSHALFGHRVAICRVVCLALNAFVNFVALIIFPLSIFLPYVRVFNTSTHDFPPTMYYDDSWLIKAIAENRQLFVTDIVDFVTKISPAVSLLLNLTALRGCFTQRDPSRVLVTVRSTAAPVVSIIPVTRKHKSRSIIIVETVLVIWGVFVAALHIHSTVVGTEMNLSGCHVEFRPWGSTKFNCAVLEVNCEVQGHVGHELDMEIALTGFDRTRLLGLTISDCSELQMPRRFQMFPKLFALKIYNPTIQNWPIDAAITASTHPMFNQLYIVRTNVSSGTIPPGLLADDQPSTFCDIEFSVSNLSTLPTSLNEKWKSLRFLVLEDTLLNKFPPGIAQLSLTYLSVARNQISMIPNGILSEQAMWMLRLGGNPLSTLPDTVGNMDWLSEINVGNTNISVLPEWMTDAHVSAATETVTKTAHVSLGGTPFCKNRGESTTVSGTSDYFVVDCEQPSDEDWALLYPLKFEDNLRAQTKKALLEAGHG